MKTQLKNIRNTVLVIIAVLAMSVILPLTMGAYAEEADTPFTMESVYDECKSLTDSDVLEGAASIEGKVPDIKSYIDRVNSNYYGNDPALHEDHLYRVIPETLFTKPGTWFYKGKEYSFIMIVTRSADYYYADVGIIDNDYKYNSSLNEIKVSLTVSSLSYRSKYENGKYHTYSWYDRSKFYLTDINFLTAVENENDLNYRDMNDSHSETAYSKYNDDGVIIRQTRLNYKGVYDSYDGDAVTPIVKCGLDIGLGYVPVVGYIKDYANFVATVIESSEHIETDVENDNEININTIPTRDVQRESTDCDYFIRSVSATPSEPGIKVDRYADMITMIDGNTPVRVAAGAYYRLYYHDYAKDTNYLLNYYETDRSYEVKEISPMILLDPKEAAKEYPPMSVFYNNVYFDETYRYTANVGQNDGYLLESDSIQKFDFVPDRNGKYTISVDNDKEIAVTSAEDNNITFSDAFSDRLESNTEYTITVRQKADTKMQSRSYKLNIEFTPEGIEPDTTQSLIIETAQTEYFVFIPNETGIYSIELGAADPNIIITIENVLNESVEYGVTGDKDLDVFLRAGTRYFVSLFNGGNSKDVTVILNKCMSVMTGEIRENVNVRKILTFVPDYSGIYTFDVETGNAVNIDIRDVEFARLCGKTSILSDSLQFYCKAGEAYYIEVNAIAKNTQLIGDLAFTPPETHGDDLVIENAETGTTVKFLPRISGKYNVTAKNDEGAELYVYTVSGGNVTGQVLNAEREYYITVESEQDTVRLSFEIENTALSLNGEYILNQGANVLSFVVPVTGDYRIVTSNAYTVVNDKFDIMTVKANGTVVLEQNNTYYIGIQNENIGAKVSVRFDPVALDTASNKIIRDTSFFKIEVSQATQYVFNAISWNATSVGLYIYDSSLTLTASSNNRLSVDLASGTFYLKAEISNVDTMISVFTNLDTSFETVRNYTIGEHESIILNENGKAVYEITAVESKLYSLRTNETLGERVFVTMYYFDLQGDLHTVELNKTNRIGFYERTLSKDIGTYYLEIQSEHYKVFEFNLFIPARITEITVNNKSIELYVNKLFLGIGETYTFGIYCNSDATFGARLRVGDGTNGVTCLGNKVTVDYSTTLLNSVVDIYFETEDGNDYKLYSFVITYPYKAKSSISADVFTVKFLDLYDNTIEKTVYREIKYTYTMDSLTYIIDGNGKSVDLIKLPNVNASVIRADITYLLGYEDNVSSVYSEAIYSLNSFNTSGKRLLINAGSLTSTYNKTINVPTNIKTLNIQGEKYKNYYWIQIIVNERQDDLYINLHNFKFGSKSTTLKAMGKGRVYLGVNGVCDIYTRGNGSNAIEIPNLTIIGNTLTVTGGNVNTEKTHTQAGAAIISESLQIENCMLTATGGSGINGNNYSMNGFPGGSGGIGIKTSDLTVKFSDIKIYGGAGGNGINGAVGVNGEDGANGVSNSQWRGPAIGQDGKAGGPGGVGGRGGDGGVALYFSWSNTPIIESANITLRGGAGGNGGIGGRGGNGGKGGNGYKTEHRDGSNDAGNGGKGGRGGNGGDGGVFGAGGMACNYPIKFNNETKGRDGIGGAGGNGGDGGAGGNGGADTIWIGEEADGGDGGNGGRGGDGYFSNGGAGGQGGVGGKKGNDGGNSAGKKNGKTGNSGADGQFKPLSVSVTVSATNKNEYRFKTTIDIEMSIYTAQANGNPRLEWQDKNGKIITYSDKSLNQIPQIKVKLQAGTEYVLMATATGSATANYLIYFERILNG